MTNDLTIGGRVVRIINRVTRPVLKQITGEVFMITAASPIYTADAIEGDKNDRAPPRIMEVLDLSDGGQEKILIVNTVLERELARAYPDDTYVGRSFVACRYAVEGKPYYVYSIAEIENVDTSV